MTCDELRDQYELYAMGVLEEPERSELATHLSRGDDSCVEGVRGAREFVALLAGVAPVIEPSKQLRNRVLSSVAPEPRASNWARVWAAVCVGLLIAAVVFNNRAREQAAAAMRAQLQFQRQTAELVRLNEALALLNDPAATQVTFGRGETKPPRGKVFVNPNRGVLLLASNLPQAPAGKIYEMWVIPRKGKPEPAGLFQSEPDGAALYLHKGPIDVASIGAVAVTLEPEAGSSAPTSQPLIVAPLPVA
jgi:anti-sigma-K factor RskA